MTTVHQLRANLELAQSNYLSADIEHPTAVHLAKEALTEARFDYWAACADLVTRLPSVITGVGMDSITGIYKEITGDSLDSRPVSKAITPAIIVEKVIPWTLCRQQLKSEGKPYPRSGCKVCGKFSPKWKECDQRITSQVAP